MNEASNSTEPLIRLLAISKTYPDGQVQALREVSLDIAMGEFVCILGPSGCGKSTLLHIMGALDRPTDGDVLFRGESILIRTRWDRLRSREIGFVFQTFYLLPNLTAEENVQLPMFEGSLNRAHRSSEARRLLELVGLGKRVKHLPNQLSIGQRQRVAIARAMANRPSVIMADEPTGSLDSQSGEDIMAILERLNREQGTTLIIVTHDEDVAHRGNRRIQMLDGRIRTDTVKADVSPRRTNKGP